MFTLMKKSYLLSTVAVLLTLAVLFVFRVNSLFGIQERDLSGIWTYTYPESARPFDSDDMSFSLDDGVRGFVSHVHNEPQFTGGCTWNLNSDVVSIFCGDENPVDQFRIVSLTPERLIIQHDSLPVQPFERLQE